MDDCGVVRDLLPLYVDGVCSEKSRALVEAHIASCADCAKTLSQLRDSACEDSLRRETAHVLAPRRWRNRAFAASCTLAGFVCVPGSLLAAMGRGPGMDYPFSWVLLLAPALLVVLAATLLPLRCRRYTGRWTLLGYTASLLLFFMACFLYTASGASPLPAEAVLFAIGAIVLYLASAAAILPWVLKELPLPGRFTGKKALASLTWDGAFALALTICAGLAVTARHPAVLVIAMLASIACLVLACLVLYKKLRMDKLARVGVVVTVAGNGISWLAQPLLRLTGAEKNVTVWAQYIAGLCAASLIAGGALVLLGAWRAYQRSIKRES